MKRLLTITLLAAGFAVALVSCKGKDKVGSDPKAVVTAFFERMAKKDLDGAAKLATKDSKGTLDMMKKAIEAAEKMGAKDTKDDGTEDFKDMVVGDAKIDGDNATVSVTNKKKNETVDFPLKKEGGDWKVDFSMATLMKMGMDKAKDNGSDLFKDENSSDTTSLKDVQDILNSDTLKEKLNEAKEALDKLKDELKDNN